MSRTVNKRHAGLLILVLAAAPPTAGAYETDQFTGRLEPIQDSLEVLDQRVNLSIQSAVETWRGPRNERRFVNRIFHDIGGYHWVDKIERWAMKSDDIDKLQRSRRESIYTGQPIWATRVAGIFGVGPTIKLNGQLIGSDKLGHFLSQGRKFYRRYLRYRDEAIAAEQSAYTERALWGQLTTGAYSNADLVANYEGFLFYKSLFEDDVIRGKRAILAWQDDHWVIQRPFTWADHVNEYWDEALNISHYDRLLYPRIKARLQTFCSDYFARPDLYTIPDEAPLEARYAHLQLRDTSELRFEYLCQPAADYPVANAAGGMR